MPQGAQVKSPLLRLIMHLDVVLNPAEIALLPGRDLSGITCVIFDVLRATSSMVTALAHGAAEIHPVKTIEEARELRGRLPQALLAGERHGDRIDGFDLGNSPFEYRNVSGRAIISTTTNGTIALRACEKGQRVLVAALLNLGRVAEELSRSRPDAVLLVCAGTFADFALEDAYAAGRLVELLMQSEAAEAITLSDSAQAALGLTRLFPAPLPALQTAKNGQVLIRKGRAAEVEWCARESEYSVLACMESAVIRACAP
jgi:2-phosphosulfolactate phosphatase